MYIHTYTKILKMYKVYSYHYDMLFYIYIKTCIAEEEVVNFLSLDTLEISLGETLNNLI